MPWRNDGPMDQKIKLISVWKKGHYQVTELANLFGVSRKTIYKWIDRYIKDQMVGLNDLSRAPHNHPNQTNKELVDLLLEEKRAHLSWGPKKIVLVLRNKYPEIKWPADSTAGEWLNKMGLVKRRKIRKRVPSYNNPFIECDAPNKSWSMDYKGQFRMGNKKFCYPLTISDNYSRYLLACDGLEGPRHQETQIVCERIFKEFGIPFSIRTDNGQPFVGRSLGGLSRLSVWWIKLGIQPERIKPGKPQQNGRHERMHRTLKEAAISPARKNMMEQQKIFNDFIYDYNVIRPHESLGQKTPASKYTCSSRPYPKKVPNIEYDENVEVRKVKYSGDMKFKGKRYFLSESLRNETVGLIEVATGIWEIKFSFYTIGAIDLRNKKILREYKKV